MSGMHPPPDPRATRTDIRGFTATVPSLEVSVTPPKGPEIKAPLGLSPLVVGTSPDCDIALRDERVSRRHCRLSLTDRGIVLADLGSKNGTLVGGAAVVEAVLPPDVPVVLGGSRLVVRVTGEPEVVKLSRHARFGEAAGGSVSMRALFSRLELASKTEETILLLGESGTGKEILARGVHENSPRKEGPFVVLDCSAVAPSLVEDELFGHVKGAFTGAQAARAGVFEQAQGGTLFIDEIGELPLDLQPKLLRALESREVRRIGADPKQAVRIDCRVVAATHRDLRKRVAEGQFRSDLYYRLQVLEVTIPPLRDRREDIPLLVERFLASHVPPRRLADLPPNAMEMLKAHSWPGNVRELRNAVARLVVFSDVDDLFKGAAGGPAEDPQIGGLLGMSLRDARSAVVERFERAFLTAQLRKAKGNVIRAAESMDVSRQMVYKLMERYGVDQGER